MKIKKNEEKKMKIKKNEEKKMKKYREYTKATIL